MNPSDDPRPAFEGDINTRDGWRFMVVTLSADERVALVELSNRQRRHPLLTASLLIRLGLEGQGLLEPEVWR
jgi:hypothetical protein